jgi:hypothetical protein
VYAIGAQRGWITPQEARDRIMAILNFFETAPNKHGFWYHIYKQWGPDIIPAGEISNIDSAIFIGGAIEAGEYFKSTYPEIAAKADLLYKRMEWDWFVNRVPGNYPANHPDRKFLSMGWRTCDSQANIPLEGGCFINDWWNRYAETPLVLLLARGSPTHSVPATAWTDIRRTREDWMGYNYIQEASLFTQQYQHIYFDLRNKHDGFANYADNTRWATLANRETSRRSPLYDPRAWGITACTSDLRPPEPTYINYGVGPVYNTFPPANGWHDGTVAPAAAGASMPFTPAESIDTLRYMYFQYKHAVWGRQGFTDSFNVGNRFQSKYAGSLNNGAMILGIENYRTGTVRDTFMRNAYAQAGMDAAGFKTYSQATLYFASSALQPAGNAGDENFGTRWESATSDPQWLAIDFGAPKLLNELVINGEAAYALDYRVETSNDGVLWDQVAQVTGSDGGQDVVHFTARNARLVRMVGTRRFNNAWAYSIWEMSASYNNAAPPGPGLRVIGVNATVTP